MDTDRFVTVRQWSKLAIESVEEQSINHLRPLQKDRGELWSLEYPRACDWVVRGRLEGTCGGVGERGVGNWIGQSSFDSG